MKLSSPMLWILLGVIAYLAYNQGYNSGSTAVAAGLPTYPVLPGGGV